jgi:hypothetical protein
LADVLGVTAIGQQVQKLTEWVNSQTQAAGKPGSQPMQGVSPGLQQILAFLKPVLDNLDVNAIIQGVTGGGHGGAGPTVNQKLLDQAVVAATAKEQAMTKAIEIMCDELEQGKIIVRNKETGDIVITNPRTETAQGSK